VLKPELRRVGLPGLGWSHEGNIVTCLTLDGLKAVELPSGRVLWTRPYRNSQRGSGNEAFAQEIQKLESGVRHCIIDLRDGSEVFELSPKRWKSALGAN